MICCAVGGARCCVCGGEPVICPKCATPFDAEAFLRSRSTRPAPPVEKELEPVGADEIDAEVETEEAEAGEEEEEAVPLEEAEEEDEELLEDASELGEDEDDMAEVIENVEEEERWARSEHGFAAKGGLCACRRCPAFLTSHCA